MKKLVLSILVLALSLSCLTPATNAVALSRVEDGFVSLQTASEIEE